MIIYVNMFVIGVFNILIECKDWTMFTVLSTLPAYLLLYKII